jgi:hypothetical protein
MSVTDPGKIGYVRRSRHLSPGQAPDRALAGAAAGRHAGVARRESTLRGQNPVGPRVLSMEFLARHERYREEWQ